MKKLNLYEATYGSLDNINESILSGVTLAALFTGCAGQDYNLTSLPKKNRSGIDIPNCVNNVYYEPRWDNPIWKQENNQEGLNNALGMVPLEEFKSQFENSEKQILVKEGLHGSRDIPVLEVYWGYVPKSCPYFGSAGPTKGKTDELVYDDQYIEDIYSADHEDSFNYEDRENFLVTIGLKFPIFDFEGESFVAEPIYISSAPIPNSSECSKAYAKWYFN